MKPGRKIKFSVAQVADALRKAGGIQVAAASLLEQASGRPCSRQLVGIYVKRHPALRAVCDEALETVLDIAEAKLITKINEGDSLMIRFFLETRGKQRGYTRKTELEGSLTLSHEDALQELE